MENAQSFAEAQKRLAVQQLMAPVYFILAGNSSSQVCFTKHFHLFEF